MSVRDHGLEASRKSATQVVSGANDEFKLRTFNESALVKESFDYIKCVYTDSVTETYTYRNGGASGTIVAVLTVVYTDSTKDNFDSVTRS